MATYKDTHHRSIAKAISWRICATIATMSIVFVISGKLELGHNERVALATAAGALDIIAKLILYYFHERIWGAIGFGRNHHPLSSLPVDRPLTQEDMQEVKNKLKDLGYIEED